MGNEKDKIIEQIERYYRSWFRMNDLYDCWAKSHNISTNTLFTLYVIANNRPDCTQREICNQLFLPKQTVSQILSELEKSSYIFREVNSNDRRNKNIKFTEKGLAFTHEILGELKAAEIKAFSQLSENKMISIMDSFELLNEILETGLSD